jgi:type 1 glutamine amidotransferase
MLTPHFAGIDKLAKKGVGLVMLHFTLEIPRETGGDYFKNWIGGYFETDWSVNPVWTAEFTTLPDHPITRGVKPFAIKDEWYYHLRFTDRMKYVTPILQTLPPASTLNREEGTHTNNKFVRQEVLVDNKPQILAWAYERPGGGRGFGFTGGHIHANWKDDNFRMIVLNAIAWTAQKEIPDGGIKTKTPGDGELESLTKKVN